MGVAITTNNERGIMLYRTYTANGSLSSTVRLPPTQFKVGISQTDPSVSTTSLDVVVPMLDGTFNDDGSNTLTGTNGAANSTDNIAVFKPAGVLTDVTAQNLLTTGSNATKTWTIANLASAGTVVDKTLPFGLWFYVLDTATLAKFLIAGTCLEIRIGSDASNYYSKTFETTDLAIGWNWITSNKVNIEDLTETGTVGSPVDYFEIEIITNNAADAFIAGDVVYDTLRSWATTDLIQNFVSDYPTFDYTSLTTTIRCLVNSVQANGFPINGVATFNEDTLPLLATVASLNDESKTNTDEFVYIFKNRIRSEV